MARALLIYTHDADPARDLVQVFPGGYWSTRTGLNYAFILDGWLSWCAGPHSRQRRGPTSTSP